MFVEQLLGLFGSAKSMPCFLHTFSLLIIIVDPTLGSVLRCHQTQLYLKGLHMNCLDIFFKQHIVNQKVESHPVLMYIH